MFSHPMKKTSVHLIYEVKNFNSLKSKTKNLGIPNTLGVAVTAYADVEVISSQNRHLHMQDLGSR
jgi:hypothetical protein